MIVYSKEEKAKPLIYLGIKKCFFSLVTDNRLENNRLVGIYIGKKAATQTGWGFLWVIFLGLVAAGIAAYAVYKYRIRVSLLDVTPFLFL